MPKYSQYDVPTVDECVNFGVGQPDTRKLPIEFFKTTLEHYGKNLSDPEVLQYGIISGYTDFRKSLASWLDKKNYSNHKVSEDELFVVNGVTGAIQLLISQYLTPGEVVLVEEPSYFLAINIFKEFGLHIDTIPMKEDGLDLEVLEEKVRKYSSKQKSIFLYSIPTCHNPTGYTISDSKRKQLASIATVYNNFYIMADEVYHFLRWDTSEQILPMADYHPNFISMGSFSKLLAPSIRMGWIYINNTFDTRYDETTVIQDLNDSGVFDSSGGINVLGSMIVHQAIETGYLDKYINQSLNMLKERCQSIMTVLDKSSVFKYSKPIGGYFLWLESKHISETVLNEAIKYKVKFHYGSKFSSIDCFKNHLRLSFSYYDSDDLAVGAERLVKCFEDYSKIKVVMMGSKGKLGSSITKMLNDTYSYQFMIVGELDKTSFNDDTALNIINIADIIVDVSSADGTIQLIEYLNNHNIKIPILSGTTGHTNENYLMMYKYGKNSSIMSINNFSKGIPVLKNIINMVNMLSEEWKVKIVETHHIHKKDSPSGTAKVLQSLITKDCTVESVREGENFGNHRIICSNDYETIEFTHQALNRNLFAKGCIDMIEECISNNGFTTDIMVDIPKENIISKKQSFNNQGITYSAHGNIIHIIENYDGDKKNYVENIVNTDEKIDGVVFIDNVNDDKTFLTWKYFNRDGNSVDFCGNGVRCIMKYMYDIYSSEQLNINYYHEGKLTNYMYDLKYNDGNIMIQSPDHFDDEDFTHLMQSNIEKECENLGIEVIDMEMHQVGVPHLIVELKENVFAVTDVLEILGSIIYEYYKTNINDKGTNINFVNLNTDTAEHSINIITWERGVDRITGSCGSGSLAAFNYYLNDNTIKNHMSSVDIVLLDNKKMQIIEENYLTYLAGPVEKYNTDDLDIVEFVY